MSFVVVTGYDSTLDMQMNAANKRSLHLLFCNVNRSLTKEKNSQKYKHNTLLFNLTLMRICSTMLNVFFHQSLKNELSIIVILGTQQ